MSLRYNYLGALTVAAALALSACSDSTGPNFDGNFDAAGTSSSLQTINAAFDTPAFQSFAALGGEFVVGGGVAAASAELLTTSASPVTMSQRAEVAAHQILAAVAAPAAILIPEQYRGLTYDYVPGEGYQVDPDRTEGPTTGVRFILYEVVVNPVTGEITGVGDEIGYVDLIDLSTDTEASVQLIVFAGGITYLDYTVTAEGPPTAPSFSIVGTISDGENQASFELSASAVITFVSVTLNLDYQISVGTDFVISATLSLETDAEENFSVEVDVTLTYQGFPVSVTGSITNDLGVLEVRADGDLFATITVTESSITVLGADEEPLDQDEINALRELIEMLEEVFDVWEDLFEPVEFLFEGPQS
ncbi:MAG: hypothetical protein JSW71_17405 [Gemmatimonadota bacterium]|nr:MAG: hypothetical protein JSW71_17405 [Gemmatimonadota bacterium]